MTAKEFIVETYPVTAKDFENKECAGLHDIAYICEKYHESKVKNLGLFSVSKRSELLKFLNWYVKDETTREEPEPITSIVDRYLKEF